MANTNNTNFVVDATYSSSDLQGYRMVINNTTKITKVTKSASVNSTTAEIRLASDNSVIGTATFSGNDATFSGSGVDVTAGTSYNVIVGSGGSSRTTAYKTTYNLPANNTDINFDAIVYYNGSWTTTTNPASSPVGGIISVETNSATNVTVSATVVTATFTIPSYTVTAIRNETVSQGTPPNATFSIPTYSSTVSVSVSPAVQACTFTIPSYSVVADGSVVVNASVQVCTFTIPAYTPSAERYVSVSPDVQVCTFSIPTYTPSVTANITISPSPFSLVVSIPTYQIVGDFWQDKFGAVSTNWSNKY